MATSSQIQLVKIAQQAVRLPDPQYRLLLQNVAGVASCRDLDNAGVDMVMAVLEDMGFEDRVHGPGYWQQAGTRRMAWKAVQLAEAGRYSLPALAERFSAGRTRDPEELTAREVWNLVEMLKAAGKRETGGKLKVESGRSGDRPSCELKGKAEDAHPIANRQSHTVGRATDRIENGFTPAQKIHRLLALKGADERELLRLCHQCGSGLRPVYQPEDLSPADARHAVAILVDQVGVAAARAAGIDDPPFQAAPPSATRAPAASWPAKRIIPRAPTTEELEDVPF